MLGLRGVRQGLRWPEIYQAQIDAILEAVADVRGGALNGVDIIVPLVNQPEEMLVVRRWLENRRSILSGGTRMYIRLGAMIETPAAALAIEELVLHCDFLSFGTNDLTQFSLAMSRDDYLPLLRIYRRRGVMDEDPFELFHPAVFRLVRDAAQRAKRVRPSLVIGLCGTQAADPAAIDLCRSGVLDYLSVAPSQLATVKLQAIRCWHGRPGA